MTLLGYRISYNLSYRQQIKVQILTLLSSKDQHLSLIYFKNLPKMRMSEKCRNNNSDNPLTSRRTNGGKNRPEQNFLTRRPLSRLGRPTGI